MAFIKPFGEDDEHPGYASLSDAASSTLGNCWSGDPEEQVLGRFGRDHHLR